MSTDFRITISNRPGTLLRICETLAEAGINLDAISGDLRPGETWGFVHLVVDDPAPVRKHLAELEVEATEHEVELIDIEDRPGAIAEVLRRYREDERNLEVLYTGGNRKLVVGPEDLRPPVRGVRVGDT
jgi:hypothetical protein